MEQVLAARAEEVEAGLRRLGYPVTIPGENPEELPAILRETTRWGNSLFAAAHRVHMDHQVPWEKAALERDAALASKNASQARKDELTTLAAGLKVRRDEAFRELLRARAAEEFTRPLALLADAVEAGDEEAVETLLRWSAGVEKWCWAYFG